MISDNSRPSTVQNWTTFIDRYLRDDFRKAAVLGDKSLFFDYRLLMKFNIGMAHELIKEPDTVLSHAEDAISNFDIPIKKQINMRVRPYGFLTHKRVRDVRDDDDNTLVSIEATVQNISTINKRIVEAHFECARCKNILVILQDGSPDSFIEPTYCSCNEEKKGVFRLLMKESKFENYQKIRIQESPEDLKGDEQPRTLDLNLTDDLADYIHPGERVIINGVMRSGQRIKGNKKTPFFDYYMDVVSIEKEEIAFEDLEITPDDIKIIMEKANSENAVQIISDSIAPSIYGWNDVKTAIVAVLFGGVRKQFPDGSSIRGDIHLLWVGDPGIAKSQILTKVAKTAPRGFYSSGLGITGAGLTAATVKDDFHGDGSFSLRAGVLALMNGGGVACIDEFGRMEKNDREKMHTAMEQQIIPIDRAGFHTTLKSQCSVLAAGNPIDGRWDDHVSPAEQLGLDNALITRFDIIFVSKDTPDDERDSKICDHILEANMIGEKIAAGEDPGDQKVLARKVELEVLRKWIAYSRRTIYPVMTDEIKVYLKEYFLKIRGLNGDKDFLHATMRQLEGPIRLSEAFARVRLSKYVEKQDVDLAISVLTESRKGFKDNTGTVDMDIFTIGRSQAQADRKKILYEIIEVACKENNGRALIELVVQRAIEKLKLQEQTIHKEIKTMMGDTIWQPETGYVATLKK
jgi:replicative DNA helicase Mcm